LPRSRKPPRACIFLLDNSPSPLFCASLAFCAAANLRFGLSQVPGEALDMVFPTRRSLLSFVGFFKRKCGGGVGLGSAREMVKSCRSLCTSCCARQRCIAHQVGL
jgi:hypothetical protein